MIFAYDVPFGRKTPFLTHPVFNRYHSETEMLRYIRRLEARDLSLTTSMIPLGSCTMKLNATAEMFPVTWPEFGRLHPFAPLTQTQGYQTMFKQLEAVARGDHRVSPAISLQPNAGSQGEYAGLLVIDKYHAEPRRSASQSLPDPDFRARHEPGQRRHGRNASRGRGVRRTRQHQISPTLKPKPSEHRRRSLLPDGHLSFARTACSRKRITRDLRDHPRERRAGLHGRREHERAGRPLPARATSARTSAI